MNSDKQAYLEHPDDLQLTRDDVFSVAPILYQSYIPFCMKIRELGEDPSEDDATFYVWASSHQESLVTYICRGYFFGLDYCSNGMETQLWRFSFDKDEWELI